MLPLQNSSTVPTLTIDSGASFVINNSSTFNLYAGIVENYANTTVKGNLFGDAFGPGSIDNEGGGTITNFGTMNQTNIDIGPNSILNNTSGGTIIESFGHTLYDYGAVHNGGKITNNVRGFIMVGSNAVLTNTQTITNYGEITNEGGAMDNSGTITIEANSTTGTSTFDNFAGTINNNGTINIAGTIASLDYASDLTGTIASSFNNFGTFNNGGSLNVKNGLINNGGSLNNWGDAEFFDSVSSSPIALVNGGTINLYGGNFGNGWATIENAGTIRIYAGGGLGVGGPIDNPGAIDNAGKTGMFAGSGSEDSIYNTGSITNYCGGEFSGSPGLLWGNPVITPTPCPVLTTVTAPEFPLGLLAVVSFGTLAAVALLGRIVVRPKRSQ